LWDGKLWGNLRVGYFGLLNWSSQYDSAIADFDNYSLTAWEPGGTALVQATSVGTAASHGLPRLPDHWLRNPR